MFASHHELQELQKEVRAMAKTIDDLNTVIAAQGDAIKALQASVASTPPSSPPLDLTPQVDAIAANTAAIQALTPPASPATPATN